MLKTYETELAGRKLVFETGKMAGLANGSVLVRYGDTVVLVNVVASKEPKEGIDFFPLSVDFEEKLYSVGKIPGGFTKREGKPGDKAILTSRAIDRPLRPLFPKDFRNDVCVVATVMSVEQDNSPEVAAMIGASAALSISDIPFGGPTAAVNVGLVDGRIIINPTVEEREKSDLTLTVAGTVDKIAMIEAGANEVPDDVMLEAIKTAHIEIKKMCEFIQKMKDEIGKPKFEYKSFAVNEELFAEVEEQFASRMKTDVQDKDKTVIDARMDKLAEDVKAYLAEKHGEEFVVENGQAISEVLYKLEKKTVRKLILEEGKRVDGRGIYDEKGRKFFRNSNVNIAISDNERLSRDDNNRVVYNSTSVQSAYNPYLTTELVPTSYSDDEKENSSVIYVITRKNTTSDDEANSMKMDNLAEVLVYSNTIGRRDVNSVPGNAMAIAKENGFWLAGYNSIDHYGMRNIDDYTNVGGAGAIYDWTRYPENDQFAPEYVTIIPPTGTAYMTIVQKNVVQIVGMCTVLVGLVIIFVIKQKKLYGNRPI